MTRPELIASAVKFLTDPKVVSAPLAKKVAFLESKGLTTQEIEQALGQASGNNAPTQGVVANTQIPPPIPTRAVNSQLGWKEIGMAGIGATMLSFAAYQLYQKFIYPMFDFPTPESLEEEQKALDKQLLVMNDTMDSMKLSTDQMIKVMDEYTAMVDEQVKKCKEAVDELNQKDAESQEKLKEFEKELQGIKELLPDVIKKNRESLESTVSELHSEIKSLKSLLANRSIERNNEQNKVGGLIDTSKGIPAWQMEAAKAAKAAKEKKEQAAEVQETEIQE